MVEEQINHVSKSPWIIGTGRSERFISPKRTYADMNFNSIPQECDWEKIFSQGSQMRRKDLFNAIFKELNSWIVSSYYDSSFSGTTCNLVVITPNLLVCAHVGDSRAIIISEVNGEWKYDLLSRDHKPTIPTEKIWIEACGGFVDSIRKDTIAYGPHWVWKKGTLYPGLAMSWSLGDKVAKSIGVSAVPDLIEVEFNQFHKIVILASDGVWEFMSAEEVMRNVVPYYKNDQVEWAS